MATYYNPKIITNNIEFSVDAANVKSWSGASSLGTDYGYFGGGGGGTKSWVDRIDFSNDTATATVRTYIKNNTYQIGAFSATQDALPQ